VYLARAAAPIRTNYLQGVFAGMAAQAGRQPPPIVDLVPLAAGDGGTGIFFVVFPLMMTGVITAIVLLQLSAWRIGRRVAAVAAAGAVGSPGERLCSRNHDGLWVRDERPMEDRAPRPRLGW
jgi:hypothetical protein